MPDRVRVRGVLSPKESDVFTDHGTVSFEFHASTKATHKIKRTVYDYRNGDFDGLRGALEALNLCNLIQDSDDINLDWTYWKEAFMSAVSDFIPTKKIKGKNTPLWITSEIIHALRKKEAARSKLMRNEKAHLVSRRMTKEHQGNRQKLEQLKGRWPRLWSTSIKLTKCT